MDVRGAVVPEEVYRNAVKVRFVIRGCQPKSRVKNLQKIVLKFFEAFAHTRLKVVDPDSVVPSFGPDRQRHKSHS
jgi:hypothetical protein